MPQILPTITRDRLRLTPAPDGFLHKVGESR